MMMRAMETIIHEGYGPVRHRAIENVCLTTLNQYPLLKCVAFQQMAVTGTDGLQLICSAKRRDLLAKVA